MLRRKTETILNLHPQACRHHVRELPKVKTFPIMELIIISKADPNIFLKVFQASFILREDIFDKIMFFNHVELEMVFEVTLGCSHHLHKGSGVSLFSW